MKRIVILTAGCLLVLCSTVSAKDYYVSTGGDDENAGTEEKPFRTMQKAAEIMAAGDTCFVRGGTYRETIKLKSSGVKDKPIRFIAWPKETVIVSGIEPIKKSWIGYFDYKTWSSYSEKTFQTGIGGKKYSELFVDGERMTPAEDLGKLDGPKKWFSGKGRLYLWPPEGESPTGIAAAYNNPASYKVEAKLYDCGFEIVGVDYVVIRDFQFVATTIKFENCKYCTVENCCFLPYGEKGKDK